MPDILLLLTEELAVVDNLSGTISPIVYADPAKPDASSAATSGWPSCRKIAREPARLPLQHATTVVTPKSANGAGRVRSRVKVW